MRYKALSGQAEQRCSGRLCSGQGVRLGRVNGKGLFFLLDFPQLSTFYSLLSPLSGISLRSLERREMPEGGIEPPRPKGARDFKSRASA